MPSHVKESSVLQLHARYGAVDGYRKAMRGVEAMARVASQSSHFVRPGSECTKIVHPLPKYVATLVHVAKCYASEPRVRPSCKVQRPPKPKKSGGHENGRVDVGESSQRSDITINVVSLREKLSHCEAMIADRGRYALKARRAARNEAYKLRSELERLGVL
jgi:hypothetical protein